METRMGYCFRCGAGTQVHMVSRWEWACQPCLDNEAEFYAMTADPYYLPC